MMAYFHCCGTSPQRLGYFKHIASAYQQCMFKSKTHEEDPPLMNAFKSEISSCWLILSNRVSCFKQDWSGQKSRCGTKSLLLEKQNRLNHQMTYFGQCISRSTKNDPFVQNITDDGVLANNIRRKLNRSIRYASNFATVVKTGSISMNELLNFSASSL